MSFPSFERAAAGAVFVLAWLMAAGCSDSTGPNTGALQVSVTTTGAELDTNGYSVAIDGGAGRVIPSNGTVTLSGLSAGSHSVLLAGLAPNCALVGAANPRPVEVVAGQTASATFSVTCTATTAPIDISGVWDFTSTLTDPSGNAVGVEEGSYDFGQGLTQHVSMGDQVGPWSPNSIYDVQFGNGAITFYSAPRLLRDWGLPYCEYDATVSGSPPSRMSGQWFCTSSPPRGTWEARRAGPLGSVTIYPGLIWWPVGDSIRVTAELRDTAGRRVFFRPVTWSSDHPSVAAVRASGIWTSVAIAAAGTATIAATADAQRGTTKVTGGVGGLSVIVTPVNDTLGVGATTAFAATVRDGDGTPVLGLSVNWSSSTSTVATVSPTGIATALAAGTTAIGASVENWSGGSWLTVIGPPVDIKGQWWFAETWYGGNYDDYPYYLCNDTGSMVLTQTGLSFSGTASRAGDCPDETSRPVGNGAINGRLLSFTMGCQYGVATTGVLLDRMTGGGATCPDSNTWVTSFEAERVGATATIEMQPVSATLLLGQSLTLTVTRRDGVGDTLRLSPVTWSSDNPAAVTVSPAGVVTAIAPGTATITAFADGRRGASTVNVNAP